MAMPRIDWTPLLPALIEMMDCGASLPEIVKRLGVSRNVVSGAIERRVPPGLRSKWKAARKRAAHPTKHAPAPPVIRQPLEPFSDVSWRALFNGNPPPVPDFAFGRDGRLH
ncbi:hypothetical protein [Gluconobacter kondonii]|uniref:hypothetical protein n=1 Tax=Gluconobacter kondonii TaxID=941463 RepID=UPI001B8C0F01|nr:hypothetical protein [Gluconobacter kondonii]MBS1082359.1 hypothetical protein [Gluconobacter kondonii]